jgi:hypothetical protein
MEPHREEPQKALEPSAEQKPKRFRIVKLEDRIAPSSSGTVNAHCRYSSGCTHECNRY